MATAKTQPTALVYWREAKTLRPTMPWRSSLSFNMGLRIFSGASLPLGSPRSIKVFPTH